MNAQVVPFLSQGDLLDPMTYKELGLFRAIFALSVLVVVFCIAKGHIKVIACGPNEGGIREFFGITLWKGASGPHLHISGIFAFRKVSFASDEVVLNGKVNRESTVYTFEITINIRVRQTKEGIRRRVYQAVDLNRGDGENDQALKQVTSLLRATVRQILEANTPENELEKTILAHWGQMELAELRGTASDRDRSTYGYEILWINTEELVEREFSEISRALRSNAGSDVSRAVGAVIPIGDRAG